MKDRIKQVRQDAGMSMNAFGEKIGISSAAVSNIENGKNNISDRTVRAVCREFGVNEEWLRTGTGDAYQRDAVADADLFQWAADVLAGDDPFKLRFLQVLSRLTPEQWGTLQQVAEMLAGTENENGQR